MLEGLLVGDFLVELLLQLLSNCLSFALDPLNIFFDDWLNLGLGLLYKVRPGSVGHAGLACHLHQLFLVRVDLVVRRLRVRALLGVGARRPLFNHHILQLELAGFIWSKAGLLEVNVLQAM